jgi:hypothetical protein
MTRNASVTSNEKSRQFRMEGGPRGVFSLLVLLFAASAVPCFGDAPDPCAAATAAVQVTSVAVEEGRVKANGTWQTGGGAAGVMLELRQDMDRMQSEWQPGAEGSWTVEEAAGSCGRHTVRMFAFPTVKRGMAQVHCLGRGTSGAQAYTVPCAPVVDRLACTWECEGESCTGTCTATANGGKPPYRVAWSLAGTERPGPVESSNGPWSETFTCGPGAAITFKARNAFGVPEWSAPAEAKCGDAAAQP